METTYSLTHQQTKADRKFERSLHAVRKGAPLKTWKKPTALLPPPAPTSVYKVTPVHFKELVQKLTGSGPANSRRLQDVAPPPLEVVSADARPLSERYEGDNNVLKERGGSTTTAGMPMTPLSAFFRELSGSADVTGYGTGLGLGPSPSPGGWFQFPISSPVRNMETSTFL